MRLVITFLIAACTPAVAQQPIGVGPDTSAGSGAGVVKFFDWFPATPSGCSSGSNGFCVGHEPSGDTYYWTAWLPNASGLPVKNGLPVVGTINDYSFGSICSGNLGILQLDAFNWSSPRSAHMTKINCMSSYGDAPGSANVPAGWIGHLASGDSAGATIGTWKSRVPFSKGGILYLPVERQISQGGPAVHDGTYIMSPDSGVHWCNPHTWATRTGGPGCDSSNWQADGDAPKCGATAFNTPCTDAAYLDTSHSSILWKGLPYGTENWIWIDYAYQDGKTPPTGVNDGCNPAAYTCFMLMPSDGALARVPNNRSIMDASAWQYYTCPAINQTYRCPGTDPASWTSNFADRSSVVYLTYTGATFNSHAFMNPYSIIYLKEFGSYLMTGQGTKFAWAPRPQGPWSTIFVAKADSQIVANFFAASPALGYNVVSTNPPRVQLTTNSNSYPSTAGSPNLALWDFVLGRQVSGEAFQSTDVHFAIQGAGYQFSNGNIAGSFPRTGLEWSFDFLDAGLNTPVTNWPFFLDRGNYSAVLVPCEGPYYSPSACGSMNANHGTTMSAQGIQTNDTGENYAAHFRTSPAEFKLGSGQNAPAAMQGNGSYSVVGVYRLNGFTGFNRPGGIWSTGSYSVNDNSMVALNQVNGKLQLDWNAPSQPHFQFISNFTFPNFNNWYFVAVTVEAQNSCGSNCTPVAKIWVGGALTPGELTDALAGVSYTNTPLHNASSKTPNVLPGPLVLGLNSASNQGYQSSISFASLMVYSRPLNAAELQRMYRSMTAKMKERGVTLQ